MGYELEDEDVLRSSRRARGDSKDCIKHLSHPHPFKLVVRKFAYFECYCCSYMFGTYIESRMNITVMYACTESGCNVHLCLACAGLGESVERHALHPQHPRIKLEPSRRIHSWCNACCTSISGGFCYRCEEKECGFELHVQCAHSLKPVLRLPSHSHPLILIPSAPELGTYGWLNCESCRFDIREYDSFARCVPCNLNYHIYCHIYYYSIPKLVMYPQGHHRHLLSLEKELPYVPCDVCSEREWPETSVYDCLECDNFTAHVSCVFRSSLPCPFSDRVANVVPADLLIKDRPVHEAALCHVCKKRILGLPLYGCGYCNIFAHESCIRRWLQQPSVMEGKTVYIHHPRHDLDHKSPHVLVFSHGHESINCACCYRVCVGFMFQDKGDRWRVLHLECMLLVPSLELIGHDHPAVLLQRSNVTKSSYLRCLECRQDFSITYQPCRFPRIVLHECHFHPLTLVSHPAKDNDARECYCDACEGKRGSNEYIYYCAVCKFEVHMACVKSEVLGPSANKIKDVEFVTLDEIDEEEKAKKKKNKIRAVFRLKEGLQRSYTHVDKEFDDIFQTASKTTWKNSNHSCNNEFLNKLLYSDEPFKLFIEELESTSTFEKLRSTLENLGSEDVVRVGEYLVPFDFDQVIETLLDKHGDFGEKCTYGPEAKQYIFVGLCKALQSMYNTKVVRVTTTSLIEWWAWLAVGKAAGFEIQFALEILERVVYAHFGLEADSYADGKITRVRKKIKQVPGEVKELRRKLEELNKELEGKEKELEEAVIEETKLREAAFRVKKSHLMEKCLTEAEDLVCSSIGELLLPPSEEGCDYA